MVPRMQFTGPLLLALAPFGFAQESKAHFDAPVVVRGGADSFEHLANWNDDGIPDVVSAWWTDADHDVIWVKSLHNDGTGVLNALGARSVPVSPAGLDSWKVAIGDLTGSGLDDILLVYGQQVHVMRHQGPTGSPLLHTHTLHDILAPDPRLSGVVIADFDQDGLNDFATYNGKLRIFSNDGGGWPYTMVESLDTGTTDAQLTVGDVNGDGEPDIILTDANRVIFLEVLGGEVQGSSVMLHNADMPMPVFGDIDGDGDDDFVVFDEHEYEVARRSGPDSWTMESPVVGGPATHLYDIDLDGDLDGMCCGGGCCYTTYDRNNRHSIFRLSLNDGTGNFAPAGEMPGLGAVHLAGAADMDQDGDIDIVAGRCIYFAPGLLTEGFPALLEPATMHKAQFVDFDDDGDDDLATSYDTARTNMGNAEWELRTRQNPSPPAGSIFSGVGYPGDWDGDGDEDLIIERRTPAPSYFEAMRLLLNDGVGGFTDGGDAGEVGQRFSAGVVGPEPENSMARDADGDGDLDLIVTHSVYGDGGDSQTRIWWNDGNGYFADRLSITNTEVRFVADLDQDGIADLLSNYRYNGITQYTRMHAHKGLGGGVFDAPVLIYQTLDEDLWDIGDMDNDGDIDVSVVDWQQGKLSVLWNDGPGTFTWTREDIYTNLNEDDVGGRGSLLIDVNDDGLLDIIAWGAGGNTHDNSAANSALIFVRLADNTGYESPVLQVFMPTAYGDADGDGDVDVFTDRLYKNRRYEGDSAGSRRQFGYGSPGTGGIAPVLGQSGPARVGELTEIRVRGAVGGGAGQIKFAFAESNLPNYPFPGMTGYAEPWFRRLGFHCDGVPGAAGDGSWTLSVVLPAGLAGTTFYHQVYIADAGAPNGWSSTNGIEMIYR